MPLVVPGVTTNDPAVAKTEEWMNKLCGKTLADHTSETVRPPSHRDACFEDK